jgi:hypothetical protein
VTAMPERPPPTGWDEYEITAKMASTRPVVTTSGETVVFARSALESALEHVRTSFVPMVIEHLAFLPPTGRWHDGEIVTAEDGSDELVIHGRWLRRLRPAGPDPDPWTALPGVGSAEKPPASISIENVSLEPRNFEPEDLEHAKSISPVPVEEEHRWSALPPLDWVFVIPVVWGLTRFAGSFLDTLGRESAEALVRWVRGLSGQAKDRERDRLVTLRFVLPDGAFVFGFIPLPAKEDLEPETVAALGAAGRVAEFAGAQASHQVLGELRQAASLWKDGDWHLAWWVAGDETVRVTNWFLAHEPDPARFLGRPLLPDAPEP